MESYLAIKNDIWPLAATWVDLVGIMLSKVKSEKRQILYESIYI